MSPFGNTTQVRACFLVVIRQRLGRVSSCNTAQVRASFLMVIQYRSGRVSSW